MIWNQGEDLKKYGVIIGKYSSYKANVLKPKYTAILPGLWLIYKKKLNFDEIKNQINALPKPVSHHVLSIILRL